MKGDEEIDMLAVVILTIVVIVAIYSIVSGMFSPNQGPVTEYDSLINQASVKYGTEATLIKAVIKQESDFDPSKKSDAGALGLMQLMPDTVESLGDPGTPEGSYCKLRITDPFDPEQNINGGTCYLSYLLNRYDNNKELALAAYNAGPTRVDACSCVPDISETQQYVRLVTNYYNEYKGQSGWTAIT